MDLRVGNRAKVIALPVGTYYFTLPSGLILEHDICYFVPILSRNIIFISNLTLNGFKFVIEEKYYFFIIMMFFYRYDDYTNCLYIFDFEILKFIITNKKNRLDNQYPLSLWHCRLGHINEMRIIELHKEKYFNNFGYDSYETYKACLLGKMTKTYFTGKSERSKELLSLIHTDI
jgi:hypothetical protein